MRLSLFLKKMNNWGCLPFLKKLGRLLFWKNWGRSSFLKIEVLFHFGKTVLVLVLVVSGGKLSQLPVLDWEGSLTNSDTDDKASSSNERDREISSFCTSTPKSINCQECMNWSECVDCFVRQTLRRHGGGRKLHFGKWTGHPLPMTGRSRSVSCRRHYLISVPVITLLCCIVII